eukprot:3765429-Heterocapsa_arctica.AAC.1
MLNAHAVRSKIWRSWPVSAFSMRPMVIPGAFSVTWILVATLVPTSHLCAPSMSSSPATRFGST